MSSLGLGDVADNLVSGVFAPGSIVFVELRPHTMMQMEVEPRETTCN
jgi:hypothetical protein